MERWTSAPLPAPTVPDTGYFRADLEFVGIEHDGPSLRVLVYVDNPEADVDTGTDPTTGYAGRFVVFGHGECWGDPGHCDRNVRPSDFDRRGLHPLTPVNHTVDVSDALGRRAVGSETFTVTAVVEPCAGDPSGYETLLRFRELTLAVYQ